MPKTATHPFFRIFAFSGRFLLWLLALCIGLILIVPIAALLFFDPNDFKPQLNRFFVEKTGLPLEINGKIDLKLFPWVGLNTKDISLSHPQGFEKGALIKIDEIGFKIPIRELLQKKLIIESLTVNRPQIFLIKNEDGTLNLDYYAKQIKHSQKAATTTLPAPVSEPAKKRLSFALEKFDIRDATLSFNDMTQQQSFVLDKVDITGIAKAGSQNFPIQGNFQFSLDSSHAVKGEAKIQGDFVGGANPASNLDVQLSFQSPEPLFKDGKLTTHLEARFADKLIFNNIDLRSGNMHLTGDASIGLPAQAPISFNVTINQLTLDDLTQKSQVKEVKKVPTATSQNTANKNLPATARSPSRVITGKIAIAQLNFKDFSLTNVNTTLTKDNDVIQLNPLTANLYNGKLSAKVTHTLNSTQQSTFVGKASDVSLQALLEALKQQNHVTGIAGLDFNLAQNAQNPLNGTVQLEVKNGVINGIDLKYYFALAQSLFSKKQVSQQDQKSTLFGSLTGTFKLHDNIIDNHDLQMSSPDFKASGEGSIYLISQTLEYKLKAWRQSTDTKDRSQDYPLALRIKGPLKHPKVEPDLDLYLKSALGKELTTQLQKHLGNKNGTQESDATTPSTTEDQIKEKVSKELERGLKKLFKKRE